MLKKIKNEPLVIFFLVASFLFSAEYIVNRSDKTLLHLSQETQQAILTQESALKGDSLNDVEIQSAIEKYIEEQILLDEVHRLGLNKDRSIEKKLLRKIRAILTASIAEPNEQQLRSFYESNKSQYIHPTLWDIEYRIYGDNEEIPDDEKDLSLTLSASKELKKLSRVSETEIMIHVGKQVSRGITSLKNDTWQGPIHSHRGQVFIRVLARYDGQQKSFNEVKRYVRDAWRKTEQDKIMDEKLSQLKANYQIRIDSAEGQPNV